MTARMPLVELAGRQELPIAVRTVDGRELVGIVIAEDAEKEWVRVWDLDGRYERPPRGPSWVQACNIVSMEWAPVPGDYVKPSEQGRDE